MPNLLTASRIVSTPFLGYMVTHGYFEIALGLFVVAGITDLVSTPYLGGWKYWQGFEPGTYALLAMSYNQADKHDPWSSEHNHHTDFTLS